MNIKLKTFKERSWMFAYFSYIAYMIPRDGINAFASFGFDATFIDFDGSQAYWLVSETDLVIVCRGTEPTKLEDITTSFDFRLINASPFPGKVHAGFAEATDDLWPTVADLVKKFPNRAIWLCGHSLGGSISALLAYRLKGTASTTNPEELYTFGCPKIGNQEYASALDSTGLVHHRFVNSIDMVPNIPPIGYEHFGRLHYIDGSGKIVDPAWYQSIKDRARGIAAGDVNFFVNHRITRYVNNLYNLMKSGPVQK
jgi:triacylglycerol lipase